MQFSRIIVYSYPRTGSMWVYNILREIVQLCRYDIIPKKIPKSDKEMLKIHKNNLAKYTSKFSSRTRELFEDKNEINLGIQSIKGSVCSVVPEAILVNARDTSY